MLNGRRIVVVMPAYNAARTIERTYREIPRDLVDEVVVTDDASHDETVAVARRLGLRTLVHDKNRGYGANQKTCYRAALELGADVVVMLHPDYQYPPQLIGPMIAPIANGRCDIVLGSRFLAGDPRAGGMPSYKYFGNRLLTSMQNRLAGAQLSEYHTGYRAFSRRVLERLPWQDNSDDFLFDNEILAQALYAGYAIDEVACPARYFPEASSIGFLRSVRYGAGVIRTSTRLFLQRRRWARFRMFEFDAALAGETG